MPKKHSEEKIIGALKQYEAVGKIEICSDVNKRIRPIGSHANVATYSGANYRTASASTTVSIKSRRGRRPRPFRRGSLGSSPSGLTRRSRRNPTRSDKKNFEAASLGWSTLPRILCAENWAA
jgi:hypothetical protein